MHHDRVGGGLIIRARAKGAWLSLGTPHQGWRRDSPINRLHLARIVVRQDALGSAILWDPWLNVGLPESTRG